MMPWNGGFGGVCMMLFGGFLFILVVCVLSVAGCFAIRTLGQSGAAHGGSPASSGRALDVLKERYARGEITKEQYDQMRRDLNT